MTRLRRMVSNILAVAYRETLVLRHDRGFMSTVTAQPVMMLLLFGFALSYTPANVPWAVLDRSTSAQSRRLVEEIRGTGYFLEPAAIQSYAQGRELLRRGDALAVLVIPRDFRRDFVRGRPQVQLLLDGTDPITAARLLGGQLPHSGRRPARGSWVQSQGYGGAPYLTEHTARRLYSLRILDCVVAAAV